MNRKKCFNLSFSLEGHLAHTNARTYGLNDSPNYLLSLYPLLSILSLKHLIFIVHMHLQLLYLVKGMLKLFLKSTCICMALKKNQKIKIKNEKGNYVFVKLIEVQMINNNDPHWA